MIEFILVLLLGIGLGYLIAHAVRNDARTEGRLALQETISLRHGAEIKALEAKLERHITESRPDRIYTDAEPNVIIVPEKEVGE